MEDLPPDRFRYQASQIQEADEDLCGNQKVDGALKDLEYHFNACISLESSVVDNVSRFLEFTRSA